jgi:uncharacterized SAM-binding protein YcdF (DUF218 family)
LKAVLCDLSKLSVYTFLKQSLTPGSLQFFLAGMLLGWVLVRLVPSRKQLGQACFLGVALLYVVLSVPLVALQLGDRLMPPAPHAMAPVGPLNAVIVLDGDNRRGRLRETLDLWASSQPRLIVLGEDWLVNELRVAGVPTSRIEWDWHTATTREQLVWVRRYLDRSPAARVALVASRLQAPRVAGLMKAAGIDAVLRPSTVDDEPPRMGARLLLPSYSALRVSRDAVYELAACVYYRQRRWID